MTRDGPACTECGAVREPAMNGGAPLPMRDPDTGAINRPLLLEAAEPVLSLARRNARTMAFLHVQLDGLRRWTDNVSDSRRRRILRGVTQRLLRAVRDSDFVARVENETFIVVLTEVWEADAAVRVAHRLVRQLSESRGRRTPLSVRIGVSFFPADADDVSTLLDRAEAAVPSPPGTSGIGFYDSLIGAAALRRAGLERDLGGNGVSNQFLLHYQPVVSTATGEAVGVEALIRWQHSVQGILPAGDFIPLAERTGRVRALDQWALGQALRDSRQWADRGWEGWVSVNLSGRTLSDPNLARHLEQVLNDAGSEPSTLVLEVTESAAIAGDAAAMLERLRALGVWVAIDDFGTGYASFEYLRDFDPDMVKLDRVFVPGDDSPRHRRLLHSMVTMAHGMGTPVVVEGVEEESQRVRLQESGCDMIQGYLLGRPMPGAEFQRLHLAAPAT